MARYIVTNTGRTIAETTLVYHVADSTKRDPWGGVAAPVAVWADTDTGICRCTACSGPLSAMLSTCPHALAVRRVRSRGNT